MSRLPLPTVSVLIVNYFTAHLTARAVASVLHDCPTAQVVVVDNSVSPEEFESLARQVDGRVTLMANGSNAGFGAANELALRHASGEFVMLLNPDAMLRPGCLARLCQTLTERPEALLVAPRACWDSAGQFCLPVGQPEGPGRELALELARLFPAVGRRLSGWHRRRAVAEWSAQRPREQDMLSGAAFMFRRDALRRIGGLFDPLFFMFYEDTDLSRRVRAGGYRLLLEPRAEVVHAWRMDSHKGPLMADGRRRFLGKHFPGSRIRDWVERLRLYPDRGGAPFPYEDLGVLERPPVLPVPEPIQTAWVLELSPSGLFLPAAAQQGRGAIASVGEALWSNLAPGRYFARLAGPSGDRARYWAWQVPSPPGASEDGLAFLNETFAAPPGTRWSRGAVPVSPGMLERFGLQVLPAEGALVKVRQPTWRTDWFGPRDEASAWALFQRAFGHRMDPALWRWKYGGAPQQGVGVWRDDRLVAFYGWAPRTLQFFGAPLAAVQCCDVMTDPDERNMLSRQGPFFAATHAFAEHCLGRPLGYALAFGFPSHRHFLLGQRIGLYHEVDRIKELVWSAAPVAASPRYRIRPWTGTASQLAGADACWRRMAASLADRVLGVRDGAYLVRRYLQHPLFSYHCLALECRFTGRLKGVVVLRQHADHCELVDLLGPLDRWPDLVAAARRAAFRHGQGRLQGWITGSCAPLLAGDGQACRVLETEITVPLARNPALAEISQGRWFLMAGDSDFH